MKVSTSFRVTSSYPSKIIEDNYFIDEEDLVFAVMDGLGGHQKGEFASGFVKEKLNEVNNFDKGSIGKIIKKIDKNLAKINQRAETDSLTTLSLLKLDSKKHIATLINIGDSRIYRLRNQKLRQLTIDDDLLSLKEELIGYEDLNLNLLSERKKNEIRNKLANAESLKDLNKIEKSFWYKRAQMTKVVGQGQVKVIPSQTDVQKEDIFLLTTDGVHDNLTNPQIEKIAIDNSKNIKKLIEKIMQKSIEVSQSNLFRSKPDDITSIAIKIT